MGVISNNKRYTHIVGQLFVDFNMKNILARGGIEFLAVILGISGSL